MRLEITKLTYITENLGDMIRENFAETGLPGHSLNLFHDGYRALDLATDSFGIVARDSDGAVLGFATVIIGHHLHTSELFAQNDTIFCHPSARARGVGGRLFALAEKEAKRRGAKMFFWSAPVDSGLTSALNKRAEFQQVIFIREL